MLNGLRRVRRRRPNEIVGLGKVDVIRRVRGVSYTLDEWGLPTKIGTSPETSTIRSGRTG